MGVFTQSTQFVQNVRLQDVADVDLVFTSGVYRQLETFINVTDVLSCSRASTGYAKIAAGTLTSFATNALRITDLGLLIEDARTNLSLQSQGFDNATYWTPQTGVAVTADQINGPDGTLTADQCSISSSGTGRSIIRQNVNTITAGAGTSYTISIYGKAGSGGQWIRLQITDNTANDFGAFFDLVNGVAGTTETLGDGVVDGTSVEALGAGWFRLMVTGHFVTSHITCGLAMRVSVTADNSSNSVSGDFNYFWGAQIEAAPFASSYIPTTTTSVTRAADAVTCTGVLGSILTADAAQSAVVDIIGRSGNPSSNANGAILVDDGSVTLSRLELDSDSSVAVRLPTYVNTPLGGGKTFAAGVKVGSCQDSSGASFVGGGGTVGTSVQHTGLAAARLGTNNGAAYPWYGYFRRIRVWSTRLSDTRLQALTAP